MGNDGATAGRTLKDAGVGAAIGTAIEPGVGTVVGAAIGGLVGLFSGGPEAQHAEANLGGRSIDARAIWDAIHPGNTKSLDDGSKAAATLQKVHDSRAQQIDSLNKLMDGAWKGGGSSAAQAGAHPLGLWLQDSAGNLQQSQTYLGTQADCFRTVHGKIQEIAQKPPSEGFMDSVNPFSDKDDEINKYNQQGQTNVQAYTAYYNASSQNAGGMPQYSAWQGNNLSGTGPGSNFGGGGGNFGGGGGGSFGGGGGGAGSFTPPKTDIPKFDTKQPVTTPPRGSYTPPNIGDPTGGYNDGTTAAGYTPPNLDTSGFGPGGGGGGFGPGGGGGGFGPGGSGSGSGAGVGGMVPGFGPGGAFSGASEPGAGGAGAGMRGAGAAGAGTAGRAGSSGMGGMGGARGGKGGEDDEHASKYLVAEDPNELFGSDELTVPPVIGE